MKTTKEKYLDKSKAKCQECKRNGVSHPNLYFVRWLTRKYTCLDCIETAYFQIKLDIANNNRNK